MLLLNANKLLKNIDFKQMINMNSLDLQFGMMIMQTITGCRLSSSLNKLVLFNLQPLLAAFYEVLGNIYCSPSKISTLLIQIKMWLNLTLVLWKSILDCHKSNQLSSTFKCVDVSGKMRHWGWLMLIKDTECESIEIRPHKVQGRIYVAEILKPL